MSKLWVPPKVAQELVDRRLDYQASVLDLLDFSSPLAQTWKRELSKIDPYLAVGKAQEQIPPGFPLEPGYWHLVRLNPGAPPSVDALKRPDGGFMEPSYALLERLRSMDLQNPKVMRERLRAQERANAAKKKETAEMREERRDELFGRMGAAWETSVSMADGWSQNAAGKRGRKPVKSG